MTFAALAVMAAWLGVTAWAWRSAPGRQAAEQFIHIWRVPWGKQFYVDFFGLQVVLALWMLGDATARGALPLALLCVAAMPIFGALPAALYWLLRALVVGS
jgi:hypothetical protein